MEGQNNDLGRILDAIEQIRGDLARLESRVAQLESGPTPSKKVPAPAEVIPSDRIDQETMMTIAAAVAAYLGKKPRIRSIRLLRSDAWAQQGRTTLQATHGNRPPQ